MDDFQKTSRVNRQAKSRPQVDFWEKSKKGGPHEDKVGKHAPRHRQSRLTQREIDRQINEFDDQFDDDHIF